MPPPGNPRAGSRLPARPKPAPAKLACMHREGLPGREQAPISLSPIDTPPAIRRMHSVIL